MVESTMIMSFHSPNLPSILRGIPYKNKLPCRTRLHRLQPSSVLVQTDESGNLFESKKFLASVSALTKTSSKNTLLVNRSNTVGIIGGSSVFSTLIFLEKIICWSSRNSKNCLPFVVCNDPALDIGSNSKKVDQSLIIENLRRKRLFLEQAGASCIVIPCNVSHVWHYEIFEGCSVHFLHVADCVAHELKEARMKPLEAGSKNIRVGLIGTNEVLNSGFYQDKLQKQGFEVILPDKATMEHIVIPSIEALHKKDLKGAQNLFRIGIQVLLVKAVNTVIIACDEFQGLLPHNDPLLKNCMEPMDALARATLRWAKSANNVKMKS